MEEQKKIIPFSEDYIKSVANIYTAERMIKFNQRTGKKREFNKWINEPDSVKMKQLFEAMKLADKEFREIRKNWRNS